MIDSYFNQYVSGIKKWHWVCVFRVKTLTLFILYQIRRWLFVRGMLRGIVHAFYSSLCFLGQHSSLYICISVTWKHCMYYTTHWSTLSYSKVVYIQHWIWPTVLAYFSWYLFSFSVMLLITTYCTLIADSSMQSHGKVMKFYLTLQTMKWNGLASSWNTVHWSHKILFSLRCWSPYTVMLYYGMK